MNNPGGVYHRGITAAVLAILIIAGAWCMDMYIIKRWLDGGAAKDLPNAVMGIITAWNGLALAVTGYHFGNSANSDRKTELLGASQPIVPTTTTVTPGKTVTNESAPPVVTRPVMESET